MRIFVVLLVVVAALINFVSMVIYAYRQIRGGTKTPALSMDELLNRIPNVPYQELGGRAAAVDDDDDDMESCVICVAPYEPHEACGVLPGCGHVFHKLCVAKWLRKNSTCPLCRQAFAMTDDDTPQANAAENLV